VKLVRLAALLFLLLCLCPNSSAAQTADPHMDALAERFIQAVKKLPSVKNKRATSLPYLVFDMREPDGSRTQLGVHLADELSDALENRLPGLVPIERSKLKMLCDPDCFGPDAFDSDEMVLWVADANGARLVIRGNLEPRGDSFNVHLRIRDLDSGKSVDAGEFFAWTEQMRAWQKIPIVPEKKVAPWKDVPAFGHGSYAEPFCISCPKPDYSEAARRMKISGTVLADVLIGEDGRVQDVFVLKCLPAGLTPKAVEALKKWQFRPITGPDGKPTRIHVPIEVTFNILSSR